MSSHTFDTLIMYICFGLLNRRDLVLSVKKDFKYSVKHHRYKPSEDFIGDPSNK